MSINRVTISGNLTRDPEIRSTQSGMNILNFGMAVNDRRRNSQTGEWEDYANFVDCVLFGNRADYLSRTLHKGTKVVVDGKLRYSSWERDGQRRSKIEVVVDDLDFVSPRQQGGYAPQGGYNNAPQQIGVAVSRDGIRWERVSQEPFLRNGEPGTWNESESGHPCIFRDGRRTYLFYQGNASGGKDWYISRTGVKWRKGKPIKR